MGDLKTRIHLLGTVHLLGLGLHAGLSYGLVTRMPFGYTEPRESRVFLSLAERLSFLGPWARDLLGGRLLETRVEILISYLVPLLLSTAAFLLLLRVLARQGEELTAETPGQLRRWAFAFAGISFFAVPVLVQDFWLSIAWGRMILGGLNPYHVPLDFETVPAEFFRGLPLDDDQLGMTYGPLWGLISSGLAWLGRGLPLLEAVLFKSVLLGCWLASIRLVQRLVEEEPPRVQCLALAIFGWLPVGVREIVGEGHNDIVLVLPLLLWIFLLEQRRGSLGRSALAASALVKYVTAPLLVVDAVHARWVRGSGTLRYLASVFPVLLLAAIPFALFYRSPEFFDPVVSMRSWAFLTPRDAALAIERALGWLTGVESRVLTWGLAAFFPFLGLWAVLRLAHLARTSSDEIALRRELRRTVLFVLAAVLYSGVGHLWPWFLIWVLAAAAIFPHSVMTRFSVGAALVAPFSILLIFLFTDLRHYLRFFVNSFGMYVLVLIWLWSVPAAWFDREARTAAPEPSRRR